MDTKLQRDTVSAAAAAAAAASENS